MLLFFGPCQTLVNRVHPTEQLEINTSYVFVIHRGHPLLFHTVTSLNLPQPSNRTLPWTWGLIVQRCLPSSASARCVCLCGSGSQHRPRCGIGSSFPPRCETGSSCLPQCETGSSVLPKRLRWSQKRCGTSSAWSCQQRGLEEEFFINALLRGSPCLPLQPSPPLEKPSGLNIYFSWQLHVQKKHHCSRHTVKEPKLLRQNRWPGLRDSRQSFMACCCGCNKPEEN